MQQVVFFFESRSTPLYPSLDDECPFVLLWTGVGYLMSKYVWRKTKTESSCSSSSSVVLDGDVH